MPKSILTTKFNYSVPSNEMKKIMPAVAPEFSHIPGCCWKLWIHNEDKKEAGGVYLFESATALEQYLNSNLLAKVIKNPSFSNFIMNSFTVEETASMITSAPLQNIPQ